MAHILSEQLKDVSNELASIRTFENLIEKKFAVFYFKSKPFLHFHEKEGKRWAHVKNKLGKWIEIPIPFEANKKQKNDFLKAVRSIHIEWIK
jgi:hypothetical protein